MVDEWDGGHRVEIDEGDWSWPKTSVKSVRNNRFGGITRINRFSANVAYNFDQNTVLKARFQDFYDFAFQCNAHTTKFIHV